MEETSDRKTQEILPVARQARRGNAMLQDQDMSYEDRYSITKIRDTETDRISMSIDENIEKDDGEVGAVMLYVPYIKESEHSHIPFDREQATALRDWLDKFLAEKDIKERFNKEWNQ